jgi:hypothetical protein
MDCFCIITITDSFFHYHHHHHHPPGRRRRRAWVKGSRARSGQAPPDRTAVAFSSMSAAWVIEE